jgi:A/G-specific adenine glycosylase
MKITKEQEFIQLVWDYYYQYKRPMPWRDNINPYWVVVSEIMLQQTQVARVLEKFPVFIEQFPSFKVLAESSLLEVLQAWQGLGYNRRGKYLWEIAQKIMQEYDGVLPDNPDILIHFPGIGKATAASIIAFAYNKPTIFIETNIRRVYIHHFFSEAENISDNDLLPFVERTVSKDNPREWYYALMDYGTYLKTQISNPNRKSKHYTRQSVFEGSNRQIRSQIIKLLLQGSKTLSEIQDMISDSRVEDNIESLVKEELIKKEKNQYIIR